MNWLLDSTGVGFEIGLLFWKAILEFMGFGFGFWNSTSERLIED